MLVNDESVCPFHVHAHARANSCGKKKRFLVGLGAAAKSVLSNLEPIST